MELMLGGRRVHYIDSGSGSKTVLLLHGWGVDSSVYHLIIDHLASYCRVLAPDLPGFGGSEEPATPFSPNDYADFVVDFTTQLGVNDVIAIGHSNGGRILIDLLSRKQCPLRFKKAILMDSAGLPAHHSFGYYVRVYTFKFLKRILSLSFMQKVFPKALENAQRKFGSDDYRKASPIMRQSMVLALQKDMTPFLSQIQVPTLLIWGKEDTATPLSDAKIMERLIPDAGLVELSGGHFAFAENFGLCRRILDSFLQGE